MKAKKYLKGGQVKLDANKDGKISGEDFKQLRGRKEMKKGGKVVKYSKGGKNNPTPTERTTTEDERRQTTAMGNQPSASYKGYEKKETPKQALERFEKTRLMESLTNSGKKYPTGRMTLQELRQVAEKEGVRDASTKLGRDDYRKWLLKNRA